MFPWLFPFGLGGFGNKHIRTKIHTPTHTRHLLLYADRLIQTDEYFAFVAFNQAQIRKSAGGGYLLTERHNFDNIAEQIMDIDRDALDRLISRGVDVRYVTPQDDAECACFELLSHLDYVAGHVDGSLASRKYMRNELKSLIMSEGMPLFFVMFAPVDFKHPLCIYLCGQPLNLDVADPMLPSSKARMRMIAENPVACARFHDFMVRTFISEVLCSRSDKPGLFGHTGAYYGTVE
ncbi:hypothetical protein OH76DRAFT_1348049, partial [Lentinus brumalis]